MIIKRWIQGFLFVIFVSFAVQFIGTQKVGAVQYFGRNEFQGYFSGSYDYYGGYVLPRSANGVAVIPGCNGDGSNAIPICIDTADELIAFLRASNVSGVPNRITGSAFIVNTMLGRNGPGNGRTVSEADWIELSSRLQDRQSAGKIIWNTSLSNLDGNGVYVNTMWLGSNTTHTPIRGESLYLDDIGWYDTGFTKPGIKILDDNGNIIYKIWYQCANPIGVIKEIPKKLWYVKPTVSVKSDINDTRAQTTTVYPGGTVTWLHAADNLGASIAVQDVAYGSINPPYTSGVINSNWKGTLKAGTMGAWLESTFSVPLDAAIDTTYCRATAVSPSTALVSWAASAPACATVIRSPDWDMDVTSKIKKIVLLGVYQSGTITVAPGDEVVWQHKVKNNGDTASLEAVKYGYYDVDGTVHQIGSDIFGKDESKTINLPDKRTITQADVGDLSSICSFAYANKESNSKGNVDSSKACAHVPYDYSLEPGITTDPSNIAIPGSSISVIPSVDNSDGPTISRETDWNVEVSTNGFTWSSLDSGKQVFKAVETKLATSLYSVPATLPSGAQLCFRITVSPWNNNPLSGSRSKEACIFVGKKPKVQVWGGDIWSRNGSVEASITTEQDIDYGSWAEYAVLADKEIIGIGSGSMFAVTVGKPDICARSVLSFTNTTFPETACDTTAKGNYVISGDQPNVSANYPIDSITQIVDDDVLSGVRKGTFKATSDFTLHGGTIANGRWLVINAKDYTVTIDGDIFYDTASLSDIKKIPQLIVIAKNINIRENVKNIDAWLIAEGGTVNTCSNVGAAAELRANNCDEPLRINGPVIATDLKLRRTYGSSGLLPSDKATPAEIINLRADAYLWASSQLSGSNRLQTVYTTELPPRF